MDPSWFNEVVCFLCATETSLIWIGLDYMSLIMEVRDSLLDVGFRTKYMPTKRFGSVNIWLYKWNSWYFITCLTLSHFSLRMLPFPNRTSIGEYRENMDNMYIYIYYIIYVYIDMYLCKCFLIHPIAMLRDYRGVLHIYMLANFYDELSDFVWPRCWLDL